MGIRQWPEKIEKFVKEVKVEMQKVNWPSRQSVIGSTLAVLVAVVIVSIYMAALHQGYEWALRLIIGLSDKG